VNGAAVALRLNAQFAELDRAGRGRQHVVRRPRHHRGVQAHHALGYDSDSAFAIVVQDGGGVTGRPRDGPIIARFFNALASDSEAGKSLRAFRLVSA
jgi:hypothetical protein